MVPGIGGSAKRREQSVLDEYDLTVVADPDKPDEYVLVPLDHPAVAQWPEREEGGSVDV